MRALFAAALIMASSTTMAGTTWELFAPRAVINFISIKNDTVGEVHDFNKLSGKIDEKGHLEITIPYANLSTGIPIRDERLKTILFNADKMPSATLTAQVMPEKVKALVLGNPQFLELPVQLTIAGKTKTLQTQVVLTRLVEDRILVTNIRPLVINAADFGLVDGINQLKELAKLSSIATVVPVNFALTFAQKETK